MIRAALTLAAGLTFAAPALAEDWDFILTNSTGKTVKTIEISASGAGSWAANKFDPELRKEVSVKTGGKTTVHFDKGSGCKYDIKGTFDDGTSAVWAAIDVCNNSYVVIRYDAGKPSFKAS
jgi:hypothetical protein